jgi:antitoxin (DNA-binding transcriptional repressor) of toxin-antitoxin stability system
LLQVVSPKQEADMRISISEAATQLTELARLASEGEEIVLTQVNGPAMRLELLPEPRTPLPPGERRKIIEEIQARVQAMNLPPGPDAAHSQDFLYDEFGLPK